VSKNNTGSLPLRGILPVIILIIKFIQRDVIVTSEALRQL